ncbi:hypothetical protein AB0H51_27895 [Streptomyces griseoluteus]|uniref:hypothetical protein n=1 Tax=Streptomyces griseoluteus TaxID=29306 RepID=UPI0033CF5E6B
MTTAPRRVVPASVALHARAHTMLAEHFREYVPGRQDGFGITSHDHTEPRRMFVRWYSDVERPEPGRPLVQERMRPELVAALERAGFVVACPPDSWDVHFADRPQDDSGPRYEPKPSDLPFLAPKCLVVDRWTRVHVAIAQNMEMARAVAARMDRQQALTDARKATAPYLWPHLERADELLGDGMRWLRQTVERVTQYSAPVQHERLDALVDVANALRDGEEVTRAARLVQYETAHAQDGRVARYQVRWVPKAEEPAVGYFPGWKRSEEQDAAIAVLVAAGLTPVQYGEKVDALGHMCEVPGFMVSAREVSDKWVDGYHVSAIGKSVPGQQERVPEVMRAAGWGVDDAQDWPETWTVRPPEKG